MLRMARRRKFDDNIFDWICANAENVPIENDLVDAYTISFGLRNVTNIDAALQEAYRVIKPGGKFLCLEFGKVDSELLGKLYSFGNSPSILVSIAYQKYCAPSSVIGMSNGV